MKIDLNNFEQIVDPAILKRGLQYFKQGKVLDTFDESQNEITAIVDGSDSQYTTTIKIEAETLVENVCSCPYDMGPICKHTVALIFHLKQEELGVEVKKKSTTKPKAPTKSKSEKELDQVVLTIENISKEQLGEFVKVLCEQERSIRQSFLALYQPKDIATSKSEYKSSLSACASSLKRHGFIDYRNASKLGDAFYDVCAVAEQRFEARDYISAINAACAVIEQATKAIQYTDDSSGCIGMPINCAMETLTKIANHSIDEQNRKYLLKYAIKSYESGIFDGWDWHKGMLEIAIHLVQTDSEKSKLRDLINSLIVNEKNDWCIDSHKELMAEFLKVAEGGEAMLSYMQENIDVKKFRAVFIENAIQIGDYNEAIRLVEDAPNKSDEKWTRYLLDIYTLMGDKDMIVRYAREILLLTNQDIKEYYTILKDIVPDENWGDFITALCSELKKSMRSNKLTNLAIWEKDWDVYLDILRKPLFYPSIIDAEKHLPKEYYPQLAEIYRDAILEKLERSTGRSYYQEATKCIRRMIKLGERQVAEDLIEELRSKYKMRRALIEELDMV